LIGRKLDEFTDVTEDAAMALHERTLEALRSAHIEMKQKEDEVKKNVSGKKKKLLLHKKRGQMMLRGAH